MNIINNYRHEIIVFFWVTITLLLSIKDFPGVGAIVWTGYCGVVIWFLMAWRREDLISTGVKIVACIGLVLISLFSNAGAIGIFKLVILPKSTPKYIIASNILSNVFVITFVAVLVVSPLLIAIFNKYSIYMALIISIPINFGFNSSYNFHSLIKGSFTIGIYSTRILAVIVATSLSSVILHRYIKTGASNNGLVTDAANDAAPHNP
jgi:hypothetical protein